MRLISLSLFMLLTGAVFKSDSGVAGIASADWSSLGVLPLVSVIKSGSPVVMLLALALMGITATIGLKGRIVFEPGALALLALGVLAACRVYIEFPDVGAKIAFAVLINVFMYIALTACALDGNILELFDWCVKSYIAFGVVFILLNIATLLAGDGYINNFPRFFGTTQHPNFLGAISAGILPMFLVGLTERRSIIEAIFFGLGSAALLWLIYLSGSRTALVMCLVGASSVLLASGMSRTSIVAVLSLGGILALADLALTEEDAFDVYDRGDTDGNTRSYVWGLMLRDILAEPVLGHGFYLGASENSFLRIAANYGIPYLVLFSLVIVRTARVGIAVRRRFGRRGSGGSAINAFNASFYALLAGALFEGYLADILGFASVTLFVSVTLFGFAAMARGRNG